MFNFVIILRLILYPNYENIVPGVKILTCILFFVFMKAPLPSLQYEVIPKIMLFYEYKFFGMQNFNTN